jgi:soluble lytic murein transglycosylase-like protein
MPVQLGLSPSRFHGLGVRHPGDRRQRGDRRRVDRTAPDRRRSVRRRHKLRSLAFTALIFALPQQARQHALKFIPTSRLTRSSGPRVSTTINSFDAVPPLHAYDDIVAQASAVFHVDPKLIRSVMQAESAFDPFAVSRAGALGLMQLMPNMAKAYGVDNPFDPRQNIMAGTQMLRELIDHHHGNIPLVLASYNAGAGIVADYGNAIPPFAETESYVKRVTGLIADARNAAP